MQGQKLAWVQPSDLVDRALQIMVKNDVSSLPVVATDGDKPQGPLKAFIDLVDLVAFLADVGSRTLTNPYGIGESKRITTDDLNILTRRSKEFRIANVEEVIDFSQRNPPHKVLDDIALKDLLQLFGKGENIHRVAVVDKLHNLIGVITQTMLLRALEKDPTVLPKLKNTHANSVQKTNLQHLTTIRADLTAFDAFITMHKACVSSLAVVSERGQIIDNISSTDLKGAITDFKKLLIPISDYLSLTRSLVIGKKAHGLVQCSASASLLDIVNLLNSTRVHRIYVTDEQGQPSGVISLTDIFLTLKATS